jgi:hypothetical protein
VVDSDNSKIGSIIDIWFDEENIMWLVLGGGFFEELLERIKAQPDIDLLVPPHFIESISKSEVKLNVSKSQLELTCEDEFKKRKKLLRAVSPRDVSHHAYLKLGYHLR